jgi:hypothetical protein
MVGNHQNMNEDNNQNTSDDSYDDEDSSALPF